MEWIIRFHRDRCVLGLLLWITTAAAGLADNPPAAGAAAKEDAEADHVTKLIEQLGSDDFSVREKAQSELAQAGLEAYDALHAAQTHHDPEIALRARYLVRSMSVRWFADTDSAKVVAILKEYGDLPEAERRNRVDRLAALDDGLGVTPLIRLARFETLDTLAKYAALQILELPPPETDEAKARLLKNIETIVAGSKRQAVGWLRLYARTLVEPAMTLADWDAATQAEQAVLAKNPERTSREIVRDLHRFEVDLLKRLKHDDEADAVIRRTFALVDGTPDQVQEMADWLINRQAWPAALEVLQKFDAIAQDNARLLYRLAGIYDKLGQTDKAEETAKQALAIKPEDLEGHLLVGHMLEDMPGLAKWAEAEYRQVLAGATAGTRPDFAARFSLSELLHDRLQELAAAETLQSVCDLMQKDESAKETCYRAGRIAEGVTARMDYFYACHFHEQGNLKKEKEHLKTAVDAYYKDADVLIAMYRLPDADDEWKAMAKEKIETVVAEFQREVDEGRTALDAADSEQLRRDALFNLARDCNQYAWLVGNTFGDHQQAVKLSQESVKICQQLPELKTSYAGFLDTLGRAFYGAGDVANAARHQAMAVALSPSSGQIRRQLEFFQKEATLRGIELPEAEPVIVPPAKPVKPQPETARPLPTPPAGAANRPVIVPSPKSP
jgi:tetratricopeptide (TPR) repeat protein